MSYLLYFVEFIFSLLPLSALHFIAKMAGFVVYFGHREFRKKTLTNLDIAYGNKLSEKEKRKIALASFQNLVLSCLEYFCLRKKKIPIRFEGEGETASLLKEGKGVIFLSGHLANWEIPFLAATELYPGIAIARPIKNRGLYRFILSVREVHGGKIIAPKQALKEGLKALKEGKFLGIVGDQAFPESSYSYPFFGVRAWTTSAPALLAYKADSPIVVATSRREKEGFVIKLSSPLWPNKQTPLKEEVVRLMDSCMAHLESGVKAVPKEWMWQHDRWKQQGIDHVKREYRYGFILIIVSHACPSLETLLSQLKHIYPRAYLTLLTPNKEVFEGIECVHYKKEEELYIDSYRYQLVFDFTHSKKVKRHYLKKGAFKVLSPAMESLYPTLCKYAPQ